MKVQFKLFSITLIASLLLVIIMTSLAQWSVDQGLLAHVNKRAAMQYELLIEPLSNIHKRYGSFDILRQQPNLWRNIKEKAGISGPETDGPRPHRFPPESMNRHFESSKPPFQNYQSKRNNKDRRDLTAEPRFLDSERPPLMPPPERIPLAIYSADMQYIIGQKAKPEHQKKIPIIDSGQIQGYIVYANRERLVDDYELNISKSLNQYLLWITGIMILLSASLALPFSRLLTKPIRPIVDALHQLANGNFSEKVTVKGKDEIAQVANDVNHLASKLAKNEDSRKKWLANISHELRTPITIMRGELEAMIDGVREINIEHITSAHQETLHLQRLIEDLYQLTSSEIGALNYQKKDLDISSFLQEELEHLKPLIEEAGHKLIVNDAFVTDNRILIHADPQRLSQVLSNIIQNSIKYTQAPGLISVNLSSYKGQIRLTIEDTAPSVKTEELERIFDHLYRAEQSRNRSSGGSGLGLAICNKIIEGHSGLLIAEHSTLGGINMIITLPTLKK